MIFSWWEDHRRILPWRKTRDPYQILVSEVMLQQTQVSRVLPKYSEFLNVFPTIQTLATASPARVLRAWKGMGYNRRALYLKQAAKIIVSEYGCIFPNDEKLLSKLPGVGTYTARAILVFAFEKDVAMVDTNIRQIIIHFFFNDKPQKEKQIQEIANLLVPKGKSWAWHQALMDYGALRLARQRFRRTLKSKRIPFRESNRFFRGRLVDALREGPKSEKKLSAIAKLSIIDSLIKDGLVVRKGKQFKLPD